MLSELPSQCSQDMSKTALKMAPINPSIFYELSDDGLIEYLVDISHNIPSRELIVSLKNRSLYKRSFTLYPEHAAGNIEFAVTGREVERLHELYWRPERRREKEMTICELLSRETGIKLEGFEVLIDIPRATSVFDLEDFRELHVLVTSVDGKRNLYHSTLTDSPSLQPILPRNLSVTAVAFKLSAAQICAKMLSNAGEK